MSTWNRSNRRRESGAIRLWPMMKMIFIFGLVASGAMLCVWQHTQNALLAREIDRARVTLQELNGKNHDLALQITKLELPEVLEAKNVAWGLGLVAPYESQIVRVGDDSRATMPRTVRWQEPPRSDTTYKNVRPPAAKPAPGHHNKSGTKARSTATANSSRRGAVARR